MARSTITKTIMTAALFGAMATMPLAAFAGSTATAPSTSAPAQSASQPATNTTVAHKARRSGEHHEMTRLQEALNKSGANLTVDGKMGPKTRAALEAYQKANGLKSTGKLDQETETALNLR